MNNDLLFAAILLLGLYFPTSVEGNASTAFFRLGIALSVVALILLARRVGIDHQIVDRICIPIATWLFFCTAIGLLYFNEITLTAPILFGLLLLMLPIQAGKLECGDLTKILAAVSILNVVLAVLMLTNESAGNMMSSYFSDFSEDLTATMVSASKPVLTFATHSLAGFFMYLFFWLNFRTYQATDKLLHLILAVLHVGICIALTSFTSLGLAVLAIIELAWNFRWAAAASATAAVFLVPQDLKDAASVILATSVFTREGGGFQARYGADGSLGHVVAYISSHPFEPIGLVYSSQLFLSGLRTDSEILIYFLRGSFVLVFLVFAGFFLFLWRNLLNEWDCYRLFALVLIVGLGATVLQYPRSFLLIPACVIYLNSLPNVPLRENADIKRYRSTRTRGHSTLVDGHVTSG